MLAVQEVNSIDLPQATKDRAVRHLRTSLELSDAAVRDKHSDVVPLSRERYAESAFFAGHLLSYTDQFEGMRLLKEARDTNPREPKYAEAVAELQRGAEAYGAAQRDREIELQKARLKQMEAEEDAEWEEDEKSTGFSDTRLNKE